MMPEGKDLNGSFSFTSIQRMSSSQIGKLNKEQLTIALKDAVKSYDSQTAQAKVNDAVTKVDIERILEQKLNDHFKNLEMKLVEVLDQQKSLQRTCESLQSQIDDLNIDNQATLTHVSDGIMEELENRLSRRNNLIFAGIAESTDGSVNDRKQHDESKILEILAAVNCEAVSLTSYNRIGRPRDSAPRLIKVTFGNFQEKLSVLRNSRNLRNSTDFRNVYINNDLTSLQQIKDKELRKELKDRKESGEDVILYRNKIVPRSFAKNFQ